MSSFGSGTHAHVDAAAFSAVLTLVTYIAKWALGWKFPDFIFAMPAFLAVFLGFYAVLYVVFLVAWSRK